MLYSWIFCFAAFQGIKGKKKKGKAIPVTGHEGP
jgi:hypothetical protein